MPLSAQPRRRSHRVASTMPRPLPPRHARPARGRDVITLLMHYPQQELFEKALHFLAGDGEALLALGAVSRNVRTALQSEAVGDVWAACTPLHVSAPASNLLGGPRSSSAPTTPHSKFLQCWRATLRLRQVLEGAKSLYKIKTLRNGQVATCEHPGAAPDNLGRWWADARAAILSGADAQMCDGSGQTLLHWAACLGDAKVMLALLRVGLDPEARSKPHGPSTPGIRPVDIVISGSRCEDLLNEWRVPAD
uniref:Uncharacterized protein n=1 Tax=Calcidiscus leptoporus TaxID=127549 RepID=A0A7S0J812_9EUKA|mmetsp:Transcript_4383/g.9968  ORF Transcript_4383/g.9968 Transcript_4383/m.9968 type:complete len:250 (+) Transcript_4383:30-779(+)